MRALTDNEINRLTQQGCCADDWGNLRVADTFTAEYVHNVQFSGKVSLGCFSRVFVGPDGFPVHAGLQSVALHCCSVADDVYIGNIGQHIANMDICHDAFICHTGLLNVEGTTSFGNGTLVAAVNEGGGREVPICDLLSSQTAYLLALYRYRPDLVLALTRLVQTYVAGVTSARGCVGAHARITDCGVLTNLRIGEGAVLEGCVRLTDGSINSRISAPVRMGRGVMADHFIVSSDSEVTDGALLDRCFVGQGCQLGKQYSATDTLFFGNCQAFHGESASVFAGPYSVTHHKGSLLIAGMFSFMNVGSSSNQSNHLYKLGPNHQGIAERGCKMASGSYLLWPARIGAFSLVMGHIKTHSDTTDMPFSYLIEDAEATYLAPAAALKSVGTIRDARKWPQRDRRQADGRLDCLSFSLFNPYIMQKVLRGKAQLEQLMQQAPTAETYVWQGLTIRRQALVNGISLYAQALAKYLGDVLLARLERMRPASRAEVERVLRPALQAGAGEWIDVSGLLVPAEELEGLLQAVERGAVSDLAALNAGFAALAGQADEWEWSWVVAHFPTMATMAGAVSVLQDWGGAAAAFDDQLLADARKEFAPWVMTGYGLDDATRMQADYEAVHGQYSDNSFVLTVQEHKRRNAGRADSWLREMQSK